MYGKGCFMPRKKIDAPSYRYHISGQAVVTFDGKNYYLGPHDSPESKARYYALLNEYHANGMQMPEHRDTQPAVITVRVVTAEYREYAVKRYANAPKEIHRISGVCDLLEMEHGDVPANEFGPRRLEQVRETFIATGNCRTYVNRLVCCVKRVFRHAISRELIDVNVLIRLDTLEPLKAGQTTAPEPESVRPVDLEHVRATAKYLSPVVSAMIRVQAATGMRPSELCNIRPVDIEKRADGVWLYRPPKHKTSNRGKSKVVPIVGDAQAALAPFVARDPDAYCFSPKESMAWHQSQKTRKTPLSCGNRVGTNRKVNPKRQAGIRFDAGSYRQAISRAAKQARVPHWFPYQLRHVAATEVRKALGVESAQALLGHSRANMTQHYAQISEEKAIQAAYAAPSLAPLSESA